MKDPFWKHDTSCDSAIAWSDLTTGYTPFKESFQACFSGCCQLSACREHPSAILTDTVYILANVQLCKAEHDWLKI